MFFLFPCPSPSDFLVYLLWCVLHMHECVWWMDGWGTPVLQHMCSGQLCRRHVLELVFTSYLDKTGLFFWLLCCTLQAAGLRDSRHFFLLLSCSRSAELWMHCVLTFHASSRIELRLWGLASSFICRATPTLLVAFFFNYIYGIVFLFHLCPIYQSL